MLLPEEKVGQTKPSGHVLFLFFYFAAVARSFRMRFCRRSVTACMSAVMSASLVMLFWRKADSIFLASAYWQIQFFLK